MSPSLSVCTRLEHENFHLFTRDVLSRIGTQPFSFVSESAGKTTPCEYSLNVCVTAQDIEPGVPIVIVHFSIELPLVTQIAV